MAKRKGGRGKPRRSRKGSYDEEVEREYGSEPDIPTVLTADELIDKAFRRASKVQVTDKKAFFAARKTAQAKLDSVAATIAATLEGYVSSFPDFNTLHPFHHDLYTTLIDIDRSQRALAALQWCRGQCATIARKGASQIGRSKSRDFIGSKVKEVYGRISSVVHQVEGDLSLLAGVRETLEGVHRIDVSMPTVVVAGAPNVGKSLLVRKMSTGKPEVAPYPFTTKAVTVGHFEHKRIRFQVLDTPGLLDRPLAERNKIELQAIMALRHLAQAIIFMVDPTEECGTAIDGQRHLLEGIREEFAKGSDSRIFVVYNKSDVRERWAGEAPEDAIVISSEKGDGVDGLRDEVAEFLRRKVLDSGRLF